MSASIVPDRQAPASEWAQWYAAQGWAVFPCSGKKPITKHGFHDATTDLNQIRHWWAQWPTANIGMPFTVHRFVLDVDPRNGGDTTLFALEKQHGSLPATLLTHTGGGGLHYHFTATRPVELHADIGDGLDIQAQGSYVIMPPSVHPNTGKTYCWDIDYGPEDYMPQPAPAWLEALICPENASFSRNGTHTVPEAGPIPEGRRETTLMALIGAMRRQGATDGAIRAALEAENQRCIPPLDADDLDRMAQSIQRYAPVPVLDVPPPVGWSVAGVDGTVITATMGTAWRKELFSKKNGELTQNVFNISRILEYHEKWQQSDNALWWDSVRGRPMCGASEITDDLMLDIASWFGGAERLPITSPRLLEQCVLARCKKAPRDLLQIWLNTLERWDGTPRLTTWLTDIAGAPSTAYGHEVSRMLPVAMVARAMMPGCQCRSVVIFEGPEELGKSTLVRELASPAWYVELSIALETKEAHMMLQGAWLAEFAELDSLSRTEETRLKAFITMREDSYIPKYSNFRQRTDRRAVFVGTTNEESYLKGQSGNTRFLPIRLTRPIDLDKLTTIRSQLFAEALHYYQSCPDTWWQLSEDALITAREEREQRRVSSVYEGPLHDWLEYGRFATAVYEDNTLVAFRKDETSWPEIAKYFLKLDTPEKWKDRSLQMQVTSALRVLGWHVTQVWQHGRNRKIWRKTPLEGMDDVPF